MPYQSTKPLATDQLNQSQADIAGNFTALATQLDPTTGLVKFPRMGADAATAATDVGLYAKLSAVTTQTELFFRRQNSGTVRSITEAALINDGWCQLPCGLIMKFGNFNLAASATATHNFNVSPVVFTTIYSFSMTFKKAAHYTSIAWLRNLTNADFQVENASDSHAMQIYYVAYGV